MPPTGLRTAVSAALPAGGVSVILRHDSEPRTGFHEPHTTNHAPRQLCHTPMEATILLAPRELEQLTIYVVADLARRRGRGLKLNYQEATALIREAILEAARDGKSVAQCMTLGKEVLTRNNVMEGVPELLSLVQIETTFDDGTKLVSCHAPTP